MQRLERGILKNSVSSTQKTQQTVTDEPAPEKNHKNQMTNSICQAIDMVKVWWHK